MQGYTRSTHTERRDDEVNRAKGATDSCKV